MGDQTAEFVTKIFGGDKSFYEILDVEKTASEDEIKRAYRKLALVHHPDRSGGDTEKFKALSIVHSILSDSTKRSIYDSTGEVENDETCEDFANWYDYFRTLFPKLTVSKIEEFSASYKGSSEEKEDLIEAFQRFKGDMKKVMEVTMFAEDGEEERLCITIDALIAAGDLTTTSKYEAFKSKLSFASSSSGKTKKKKMATKSESNMDDLAAMILANRQSSGAGMFGSIMAKYGGGNLDEPDIPDDAFEATKKRVVGSSSSSSNTGGSKSSNKGGAKASRKS